VISDEPLQPQDLVITLLGTYVRPFARQVWSGGLVTLLAEFGFSDGAARAALTRLVRRDLIARVRAGRLVHYRLTPRCERLLIEGDGRIFSLGRLPAGAGPWTVLWHAIPEDRRLERTRLGRRLRFLGFGSAQDSVWVAPNAFGYGCCPSAAICFSFSWRSAYKLRSKLVHAQGFLVGLETILPQTKHSELYLRL